MSHYTFCSKDPFLCVSAKLMFENDEHFISIYISVYTGGVKNLLGIVDVFTLKNVAYKLYVH